ncbi:uncharacterized protein [Chelonus insularis]|uniref:uncharacterized protein n=1 Tax=Chelonus insularis TaxID=460826 RepID=UPI00158987BA|nr:uncharacterized protein LOC118067072 [Chelonus insularis]
MALIPKYFFGFVLLFTCGYLSSSVLCDTYHYISLLDNENNKIYLTELSNEAMDLLEKRFPDISINPKFKKASLHGSIRKCVNVLGTLGYRIFHYPTQQNLPEWILEKRIPSESSLVDPDNENNVKVHGTTTYKPL